MRSEAKQTNTKQNKAKLSKAKWLEQILNGRSVANAAVVTLATAQVCQIFARTTSPLWFDGVGKLWQRARLHGW